MTVWKKIDVQGDLQPIVAKARGLVARVYQEVANEDLYITSQRDGIHGTVTLHYDGYAFDCRKPTNSLDLVVEGIKSVLGDKFDVIVEHDHIHIEYDPT